MLMLVLASSASIVRIVARLTEELVEKRISVSVKLVISIAHGGSVVSRPGGAGQAIDERGSSTVRGASDRRNVSGGGGGQRTSVGAGRDGARRRWWGRLASKERSGGYARVVVISVSPQARHLRGKPAPRSESERRADEGPEPWHCPARLVQQSTRHAPTGAPAELRDEARAASGDGAGGADNNHDEAEVGAGDVGKRAVLIAAALLGGVGVRAKALAVGVIGCQVRGRRDVEGLDVDERVATMRSAQHNVG